MESSNHEILNLSMKAADNANGNKVFKPDCRNILNKIEFIVTILVTLP